MYAFALMMHFTDSVERSDSENYTMLIIIILPVACGSILLLIFVLITCIILCAIKRMCVAKKTPKEDHSQQPAYEEITQIHKDILMKENAAYGHITHTTKNHQSH